MLPPVRISRKEAFRFGLARKLLAHYEGPRLHLDMRSVLEKIAASVRLVPTRAEPEFGKHGATGLHPTSMHVCLAHPGVRSRSRMLPV